MRISRKIKEIFKQMAQIEAIVDNAGLNDIEYYLIKQRYFEGENMSFIAVDIGYSERGAREIKYRALKKIYQEMVRKHILKCQYAWQKGRYFCKIKILITINESLFIYEDVQGD